jgi:hypothetical protein
MLRDKHDETSSDLSLFCEMSCEDSQLNEKKTVLCIVVRVVSFGCSVREFFTNTQQIN